MVETSAGKKLSEARLRRGLSIDAAAHVTKMRPDKILALENDDYTRFGGLTYARSFLLLYSRFLGVDVAEQLRDLDHDDRRVNIQEYQYLNHDPAPKEREREPAFTRRRDRRERRPPSIMPLLVFVGMGAIALAVMWYRVQERRLGLGPEPLSTPAAAVTEPSRTATGSPGETSPEEPVATPATVPANDERESDAAILRRETAAEVGARGESLDEILVIPLRKTYVTVRRNSAEAPSCFDGFIYPEAPPLKLRGGRFFIEVQDQSAVQIRKNGHPIAYQSPAVALQ